MCDVVCALPVRRASRARATGFASGGGGAASLWADQSSSSEESEEEDGEDEEIDEELDSAAKAALDELRLLGLSNTKAKETNAEREWRAHVLLCA